MRYAYCALPKLLPNDGPFIPAGIMARIREGIPNAPLEGFPSSRHGLPFHVRKAMHAYSRIFLRRAPGGVIWFL